MGWIAACVLCAVFLPMGAFLYLDILETRNNAERALKKIERIEKRIERKDRDKEPRNISDNPVFGRVPRSVQVSMPRPPELGKTRM